MIDNRNGKVADRRNTIWWPMIDKRPAPFVRNPFRARYEVTSLPKRRAAPRASRGSFSHSSWDSGRVFA